MGDLSSSLQYICPHSAEAPKSRSLDRKQPDPVVLTKWRHSTTLLDLNDKVGVETPQGSLFSSSGCQCTGTEVLRGCDAAL